MVQGCIWAAPFGKWRRKISTGALFGKQCARHGALFSLRAHFLKMGAPDFSNFLDIFLKILFPFNLVNSVFCLLTVLNRLATVRENQKISQSILKFGKIRETRPFLEKIRGKSVGYYIMDKGKKNRI